MIKPDVTAFFHEPTNTVSYLVTAPGGTDALLIDPVLDYDAKSGRTSSTHAEEIAAAIAARKLTLIWVFETHIHADHLSAAPWFAEKFGAATGIGAGVVEVQKNFGEVFGEGADFPRDGSQFSKLFADGEKFEAAGLEIQVLHTPGHTPACVTYVIGDAAFVGDTIFMPDYGTARCDFPGGDAATLYHSIQRILTLPPETRIFVCHDYRAPGRAEFAWETTVAAEREANVHIGGGASEADFVELRTGRDANLAMPALLIPSVQINMRAGQLPPESENGTSYLKIPINRL